MKDSIKKLWLKALRSGKYKQGRHYLATGNGKDTKFCCLGVLADVAIDTYWEARSEGTKRYWVLPGRATPPGLLPDAVCAAVGLTHYEQVQLAELNDGGAGFEDIAEWIETYL